MLDLSAAENEEERRAGTLLLFGGLSERVEALCERLVVLRTLCEASLDFDEADTGNVPREELARLASGARDLLCNALSWEVRRGSARAEPRIVLAGRPNAGKGSLVNARTGGRALVSRLAGTTRDSVRAAWRVGGVECVLYDTAGLDDRPAALEILAKRAEFADDQASADLLLWVVDAPHGSRRAARGSRAAAVRSAARSGLTQTDRASARATPPAELLEAARAHASVAVSVATRRVAAARRRGRRRAGPGREALRSRSSRDRAATPRSARARRHRAERAQALCRAANRQSGRRYCAARRMPRRHRRPHAARGPARRHLLALLPGQVTARGTHSAGRRDR